MSLIERLISVIAPFQCIDCDAEGSLLCTACRSALPAVPSRCYRCNRSTIAYRTCSTCRRASALLQVWVSTPYDGTAKTLLHKLKFERASAAAQDIAAAMAARMQLSGPAVVSYIPTAPSRVRMRGYDQAQRIARELARQLGLPYAPLLTRVTSARQVGQNREVRRKQMQQAFRPTHAARQFKDAHVLLVDDVITTGATCEAAAAALREAGISRVSVSVFAAA